MPYYQYGSPRCPFYYELGDHPHYELFRAYWRDPESRTYKPIGWFCPHCGHTWSEEDDVLLNAKNGYRTNREVLIETRNRS